MQLVKKFPAFHGTRRFINALTSVRRQPNPVHIPTSHLLEIHPNIVHPYAPSGLLPSGFPTKTLHTSLSSPIRATSPNHLILLNFITRVLLSTPKVFCFVCLYLCVTYMINTIRWPLQRMFKAGVFFFTFLFSKDSAFSFRYLVIPVSQIPLNFYMLYFIIPSVPPAIYSVNSRMIDERRISILKKLVMVYVLLSLHLHD